MVTLPPGGTSREVRMESTEPQPRSHVYSRVGSSPVNEMRTASAVRSNSIAVTEPASPAESSSATRSFKALLIELSSAGRSVSLSRTWESSPQSVVVSVASCESTRTLTRPPPSRRSSC